MNKLQIELVPSSSWYNNLRSILDKKQWDAIRKYVYKNANHKCEICSNDGIKQKLTKHPVEAHEVWEYDDINHIQRLKYIEALCPKCHRVKHIGLAQLNGQLEECIDHLMTINSMTKLEAIDYIRQVFETFNERSNHEWQLDISILEEE